MELQAAVGEIRVDELILDYLLGIVGQTRRSPQLELGVSTRGALALQRAAQARALLQGRTFVIPDDVKALAVPVLAPIEPWLQAGIGGLLLHVFGHDVAAALTKRKAVEA